MRKKVQTDRCCIRNLNAGDGIFLPYQKICAETKRVCKYRDIFRLSDSATLFSTWYCQKGNLWSNIYIRQGIKITWRKITKKSGRKKMQPPFVRKGIKISARIITPAQRWMMEFAYPVNCSFVRNFSHKLFFQINIVIKNTM